MLNRPAESWRIWALMQATGNKFLPSPGGLLDQPEWLMDDLTTISWISELVKADVEKPKK